MRRAEIVGLLDRLHAAYDERDVETLAELHAEDGIVESLLAGTVKGRAAIGDVYRAWLKAFPDVVSTTDDLVIDGNRAVEVVTVAGSDRGGLMGLPPSHKPFRLPIVRLYTFDDGYIAHERRVYDFTGLLVQIGILKTKPA